MSKAIVKNCHLSFNAQHNEHSQAAIEAIAYALAENAKALGILASNVKVDLRGASALKVVTGESE